MVKGARKSRPARPARRAIGDRFIVPVRGRDCAGSGPAPDEFKLFKKSAKWFLRQESALGGVGGICYSRRTDDHGKEDGGLRSGARPRPERGRRPEYDRDRGHRPVRGEFPGDSGDGRAAGFDRLAGRGPAGNAGCFCVVRAGRGDAKSRGHVRLSAGGLRSGTVGPADVVSICVADLRASSALGGLGFDRICAIRGVSPPAFNAASENDLRKPGDFPGDFALPANHHDRKDFGSAVGGRGGNNAVADLGRDATFRCQDGL